MKIKFLGATGVVTGSCHLLKLNGKQILIDCGMFQGGKEISKLNFQPFKFDPKKIDALILTHAHIDHSGLIPKLCKKGFKGKIYCTPATKDLCRVMLEDSGKIQEFETKWDNKRLREEGRQLRQPLYTTQDAKSSIKFFRPYPYNKLINLFPGIKFTFRDAGHIIGSSIVELFVNENEKTKKLVFSGDLGQVKTPIINDPTFIKKADYVISESTYGGSVHENPKKTGQFLIDLITKSYKEGNKIIIPSFAIERTQEIIYRLNDFAEKKLIPPMPVFIDSPLATKATNIFKKHTENYNQEILDVLASGDRPFSFPKLKYTKSVEESKRLNSYEGPAIIISASGMCTGGRIKHHLIHNITNPNNTILFVGYQAKGTLGRKILHGQKSVKIYGKTIQNRAKVYSINGYSSHADQPQLLAWLRHFTKPHKTFFVHGEPEEINSLRSKYGEGTVPKFYQEFNL